MSGYVDKTISDLVDRCVTDMATIAELRKEIGEMKANHMSKARDAAQRLIDKERAHAESNTKAAVRFSHYSVGYIEGVRFLLAELERQS